MVQISEIDPKRGAKAAYGHEDEIIQDSDYTDVEEGEEEGEGGEEEVMEEEEEEEGEKRGFGLSGSLGWRRLPLLDWLVAPFSGSSRWSTKRLWTRMQYVGRVAGNLAWIFTTSMLLVGLPVLFAYDREKALQEQQLLGLPTPAPN